ncbi:MAG: tRNA (adenosine(37)-N6)-dimethylallyltransferase MiaA [Bacteroidia bacterium]|nr:tRNA (adenosine(37)-N6)-dimethylallyltransferase MiaA [Bacteroidia bacterium]
MKRLLLVIGGATACGKSQVALSIAKKLNTAVISADSRQVYRDLDIGTAKLMPADRQGVPHYLIDCCDLHESYNAGKFTKDALEILSQLFLNHQVVVLCGGTGLFIQGVISGFAQIPEVSPTIREQLNTELTKFGLPRLVQELAQVDPKTAQNIDCHNPHRVLRALEVFRATGKPLSYFHNQQPTLRDFDVLYCVLSLEKNVLHARIEARTRDMLFRGLAQETQNILQKYPFSEIQALQTVGYQECISYLHGKITARELPEQIILRTKQYAKRQITWFNKVPDAHRISAEDPEFATQQIMDLLEKQLAILNSTPPR